MRNLIGGLVLVLLPMTGNAESVTDLAAQADGTYVMKIDGNNYVALSSADLGQITAAVSESVALKQKLAEVTAKLERYQALTEQYEQLKTHYADLTGNYKNLSEDALRLNGEYSVAANNLVTLNQDYSKLVKDYDSLTEKYRNVALRSRLRNPLDIGLGALSADDKAHGIAMIGAGTQLLEVDVRGWLFGGRDTYGLLLGASF